MEMKFTSLFFVLLFFFSIGYLIVRKNAKRAFLSIIILLITLFLVLAFVLEHDSLLAKLPLWMQKEMTLLLWLDLGGVVGLLNAYYITLKRVILTILLDLAFLLPFWYYNQPVYKFVNPMDITPYVTYQTTLYSCACASLSTLAKQQGIAVSEREACRLMGTTRYGSNPGQIRYAAKKLGFNYKTLFGKTDIEQVSPPAVLFADRRGGYENHAVAYIKKKGRKYLLFDPMEGWKVLDHKQMQRIWHGRGIELF